MVLSVVCFVATAAWWPSKAYITKVFVFSADVPANAYLPAQLRDNGESDTSVRIENNGSTPSEGIFAIGDSPK